MGILNQGQGKRVTLSIMACGLLLGGFADTNRSRAQDGKLATPADRPSPYPKCVKIFDGKTFNGWEADPSTLRMTFVSRRAEAMLGYPRREDLGDPDFWTRLIHPEDRERSRSTSVATRKSRG